MGYARPHGVFTLWEGPVTMVSPVTIACATLLIPSQEFSTASDTSVSLLAWSRADFINRSFHVRDAQASKR